MQHGTKTVQFTFWWKYKCIKIILIQNNYFSKQTQSFSGMRLVYFDFFYLSKMLLTALSPESWGIEGYISSTSNVTRMALLGIYWMSSIFPIKSPPFLIYGLLLCITSLRARSLVVSDLRGETKGSRFESGCYLFTEVSSLQ